DEHLLGADGEVHGPAYSRDRVRGAGVPVGEVAGAGDLEGAENAHVEVAAAHHGERVGVVEVARAGRLDHRDLAGVDQVGVDLVRPGGAPHSEHAVLGVQRDPGVGRQVVGDRGGLPDAEVEVGTLRDVGGDAAGQLGPVQRGAVGVLDGHRVRSGGGTATT